MSTTLTNGLKLPDKGSVDWYADMQNNYQILDGAVGTVAEHTTQIAGKAPAVHTHTKADVTDLFNSANTWSGNNTYSKPVVIERNTDTDTDTGSFLVAKHTAAELGSLPSSDQSLTWAFKDKNNNDLCYARVYYETTGGNSFRIFVRNKYTSGAPSTSGTVDYTYFGLKINADKSKEAVFRASLRPYDSTNAYNLGDSTFKWKTLNGINPGALSLPKGGNTENIDWFDISSHITNVSGNAGANRYEAPSDGWIVILGKDEATSSIFIWNRANSGICASAYGNGTQGAGRLTAILPVRKGMNMGIICKFSSASDLYLARFYPCEGNV